MKVILDINSDKADAVLQVLRDLPYVKIKSLSNGIRRNSKSDKAPTKQEFLQDLKEAIEEVKLIKAGKKKGRPARDVLEELRRGI